VVLTKERQDNHEWWVGNNITGWVVAYLTVLCRNSLQKICESTKILLKEKYRDEPEISLKGRSGNHNMMTLFLQNNTLNTTTNLRTSLKLLHWMKGTCKIYQGPPKVKVSWDSHGLAAWEYWHPSKHHRQWTNRDRILHCLDSSVAWKITVRLRPETHRLNDHACIDVPSRFPPFPCQSTVDHLLCA
jgi:hypothetical protein